MQVLLNLKVLRVVLFVLFLLGIVIYVLVLNLFTLPSVNRFIFDNKEFKIYDNRIEIFQSNTNGIYYKLWESEEDIKKIEKAFIFDLENDNSPELVTLVWTNEDYFASRDYLRPIRGNKLSQHIRVYNLEPQISIKWGGSTMAIPLVDFTVCGETIKFLCGFTSTYDNYPEKQSQIALLWDGWSFLINPYPDYSKYKRIFITGETMLGREVGKSLKDTSDKSFLFSDFSSDITNSDLAIISLESVLVNEPVYCGPECLSVDADIKLINVLKDVGFDIFALASNHQGDDGQIGYLTLIQELQKNVDLKYSGIINNSENAITPVISKLGNINVGFISFEDVNPDYWYKEVSYDFGTNFISKMEDGKKTVDLEKINKLKEIKQSMGIDMLIVHLSWGDEYESLSSLEQQTLAHLLIDNGVDFIYGTHPHVTQEYEIYKSRYIFYSLGNFIFDQTNTLETRNGEAITLYINDDLNIFPEEYIADISIQKYFVCGPHQSSIDLREQFIKGEINLKTLSDSADDACVYYMPVKTLK